MRSVPFLVAHRLSHDGRDGPPDRLAGLTPGGGHGYLMRTYGLACDQLLSVGVVTADGPLRACARCPPWRYQASR